jgi:hypothetical protein
MLIYRPSADVPLEWPDISAYLYFSRASELFDMSSLKNTSLSVYILFATISRSFLVSALNSFFSVWLIIGSGSTLVISISFSLALLN